MKVKELLAVLDDNTIYQLEAHGSNIVLTDKLSQYLIKLDAKAGITHDLDIFNDCEVISVIGSYRGFLRIQIK